MSELDNDYIAGYKDGYNVAINASENKMNKLLRVHETDNKNYADDSIPDCPICGSRPYIHKDYVDGFYFGFSVGCPRYRINDGIHGADEKTPPELRLTAFGLNSKEECVRTWKYRVSKVLALKGKQENAEV